VSRHLYLTPMLGGPGAPRYPVTEERQLIGRAEQSDVPLFEPTVSRRHATVHLNGDEVVLEDLDSKHGTFVNSRRVSRAKLKVGDIVVFGLSLVLRLEASNEPIPPVEPLKVPSAVQTAIHSIDEQFVTAVREERRRPRTEGTFEEDEVTDSADLEKLQDQLVRARRLAEAGALCVSMLPEAKVRLTELRKSLERSVEEGAREVDAYQILASVESVAEIIDQLADAASGQPEKLLVSRLRRSVTAAVGEAEPKVAERGVSYLVEVPEELKVRVDAPLLVKALAWFLTHAGSCSRDDNPVEVLANEARGQVVITISHLGRPYPQDQGADPVALELRQASEVIGSLGGSVTVESKSGIGSTVRISLPMPI
jgi:pSer/pThr/pTyr-binding forkhead associated (FHA) protein